MTKDEAIALFAQVTDGELGDLDTFLELSPEQQAQILWNMRHRSWAKSPDVWGTILTVAGILAQVGLDVSGIEGGIAALRAL